MSFVVFCKSGSLRKQILRWKKLQAGRFIWYILGTNNLGGDRIGQRKELNCNAIQAKTSADSSGLFGGHSELSWLGMKELKLHQPINGCRVPTGGERVPTRGKVALFRWEQLNCALPAATNSSNGGMSASVMKRGPGWHHMACSKVTISQ